MAKDVAADIFQRPDCGAGGKIDTGDLQREKVVRGSPDDLFGFARLLKACERGATNLWLTFPAAVAARPIADAEGDQQPSAAANAARMIAQRILRGDEGLTAACS